MFNILPGPWTRPRQQQSCRYTCSSSTTTTTRPPCWIESNQGHLEQVDCKPGWLQSFSGSLDSRWACPGFSQWRRRQACGPSPSASNPASAGGLLQGSPLVLVTWGHFSSETFLSSFLRFLPVTFLYSFDNILVGPIPIRSLPIRHHLPHHDAKGPGIWWAGKFPECNCFWCRPPDRDLAPPGGVGAV